MHISNRRPFEPDHDDIVAGTLWSDPVSRQGVSESSRGIGILFGPDITQRFLGKANYFHIFGYVKMNKKGKSIAILIILMIPFRK